MKVILNGAPSFAYLHVDLAPGESIIAESDAMSSMSADLDMTPRMNGSFFSAMGRKLLGKESFFINEFVNNTGQTRRVTLTQRTPGDIREVSLNDEAICLQPGAYISSTPELDLAVQWAGFGSWIAREGLFRLKVKGTGKLWYGAYGQLLDRKVNGEMIVDTSHLVAYDPDIKLKLQFAGGMFSSFFSGEGLITRLEGDGNITIQTRSLDGLKNWLNPKLY